MQTQTGKAYLFGLWGNRDTEKIRKPKEKDILLVIRVFPTLSSENSLPFVTVYLSTKLRFQDHRIAAEVFYRKNNSF